MEYSSIFPDRLASDEQKKSKEYALKLFRAVYASFMQGENSYYHLRNSKIADNRLYAAGRQPIDPLLDLMGIDGKQAFINIDFKPAPISPKFRQVVVDGYMMERENVKANSTDSTILSRKERRKNEALFAFNNRDYVKQLEETSGLKLSNNEDFESEEEIDIWYGINDREREEMLMEKMIRFVLKNNDLDILKRRSLSDLWDAGFAVIRNYWDNSGRLKIENVRPEAMLYGSSFRDDFKDSDYIGHVLRMNISEFRLMFPYVDEKRIHEIAKQSSAYHGSNNLSLTFLDEWYNAFERPYDDVKIELMYIWYKCDKSINYIKGEDSRGRKILDVQKEKGKPTNPKKEAKTKRIYTAYTGYWVLNTDMVLEWGEERNQLRPHNSLEDIMCPYSIMMPNNDGLMMPKSLQDMIKPSIRSMDECLLRYAR